MLEGIRTYMMKCLVDKVKMFETTKERVIYSRIKGKIEKGKLVARHCMVRQALELVAECEINDFRYVIDIGRCTCTCGYWDGSGIPCVHAILVCSFIRKDVYTYPGC